VEKGPKMHLGLNLRCHAPNLCALHQKGQRQRQWTVPIG